MGVGHLVTLVAHANANGGRVVLCCVPPFVSVVFSVTKLERFFDIAETVEGAVAKLKATPQPMAS
jgi:anti-anti-sigma factor